MPKIGMREQPPDERAKNFDEVALCLSEEDAVREAKRCLQCKKAACIGGCPVEIDIPAFIKYVAENQFEKALNKIREKNSLPAICGRVCPQEDQCEKLCVVAKKDESVGIGNLERFVADWGMKQLSVVSCQLSVKKGTPKVAVIGSGPSGLVCAGDLAKLGYDVTIFESLHK